MRKQFSVLATSVLLVSIGAQAQLVTYNLGFTPSDYSSEATLSGQMTIDTSNSQTGYYYVNDPFPSWFQSLTLTYTSGGNTTVLTKSDFTSLTWDPLLYYEEISWNEDLIDQIYDVNFYGAILKASEVRTIKHIGSGTEFYLNGITPVPEPSTYAALFCSGAGRLWRLSAFETNRSRNQPLQKFIRIN